MRDGFHNQREQLLKTPEIDKPLAKILVGQDWYDLFREVRTERTHFGTGILAWGYDKELEASVSQLIIEVKGRRQYKALTKGDRGFANGRYNFDIREIDRIKNGVLSYLQGWSKLMLERIDPKNTVEIFYHKDGKPAGKRSISLKQVLDSENLMFGFPHLDMKDRKISTRK